MLKWFINLWRSLTSKKDVSKPVVTVQEEKVIVVEKEIREKVLVKPTYYSNDRVYKEPVRPTYYSNDRVNRLNENGAQPQRETSFADNVTTGIVAGVVTSMLVNELNDNDTTVSEFVNAYTPTEIVEEVIPEREVYEPEPVVSFASRNEDYNTYSSNDDGGGYDDGGSGSGE